MAVLIVGKVVIFWDREKAGVWATAFDLETWLVRNYLDKGAENVCLTVVVIKPY